MKKKIILGSLIAVVLLILVSIAPSINASVVKDELVELNVELCGLGKKHTVELTQQEADDVETLFDDIEQRLSEVETREDAGKIFKDAVVELDKYGLLGGISVKQAQRLVTRRYFPLRMSNSMSSSNHLNYLCMVAGRITDAFFWTPVLQCQLFAMSGGYGVPPVFNLIYSLYRPILWLSYIEYIANATGWLFSFGLKGHQFSDGNLSGNIRMWFIEIQYQEYAGVSGFTGLKLFLSIKDGFPYDYIYLGTAFRVDVDVT